MLLAVNNWLKKKSHCRQIRQRTFSKKVFIFGQPTPHSTSASGDPELKENEGNIEELIMEQKKYLTT